MAKTKPGIRISLDDSVARGTKFANKAGFDAGVRKLGPDSQPGPNPGSPGAPFFNSRRVDDFDLKRSTFWAGNGPTPGGLNDVPKDGTAMGFDEFKPRSETNDSPVPKQGRELPNPKVITKADEARIAEAKIGNAPSGVLAK
jgi:hypothetical protein